MKDAQDIYRIGPDPIDEDIRQGGHHQLSRTIPFAFSAAVGEILQSRGGAVNFTYQPGGVFGGFLEKIVRNIFQIVRGGRGPANLH